MQMLTKWIKEKQCIKLVFITKIIKMHGQQNKKSLTVSFETSRTLPLKAPRHVPKDLPLSNAADIT
jgi:hypothetical protein